MTELRAIAPTFTEMAHRIVWCTVATADAQGVPHTRVLHPIWEWDGERLTGWVATSPNSPKARDLRHQDQVSLTYWAPNHDTCTAECRTAWEDSPQDLQAGWDRFLHAPEPVGYDPRLIPTWTDPTAEEFGILRLEPHKLRVMPGSLMIAGRGELLKWRR